MIEARALSDHHLAALGSAGGRLGATSGLSTVARAT
jgi:hypothetical protein